MRKWIPGGPVEGWKRLIVHVAGRHQSDSVCAVRVQIDPRDVALMIRTVFVALKEEMSPVVVIWVRAVLVR